MRKKSETAEENQEFLKKYDASEYVKPSVTTDIVVFGMFDTEENNYRKNADKILKILLVKRKEEPYKNCYALPGGFVRSDETLVQAAERELREETNLPCDFLEQFGTYSTPGRDPRGWIISNGFMALLDASRYEVRGGTDAEEAKWFELSFRQENGLWKICLKHDSETVRAAVKDTAGKWDIKRKFVSVDSDEIAFDHEIIIADAVTQLRRWITDTHIAFRLLPEKFTLRQLQQIHEVVLDTSLLAAGFRRKIAAHVKETGEMTGDAGHRPAMLYKERDLW